MKLSRILNDDEPAWAILDGEQFFLLEGSPFDGLASLRQVAQASTSEGPLLAPAVPGKIIAIGRNYAEHAAELGNAPPPEPLIFLKPPSAVVGPDAEIVLPRESERVDHEAELAIVIGRRCRRVRAADWRDVVLGFTCANDVTARDLQQKDVQFTRAKSFDSFCPLGPFIETDLDVSDLVVECRVDGEIRQSGRTSQMIFPPSRIVEFVSGIMTLEPGDVILTGTPSGVGPLAAGNLVEVSIDGLGTLRSRVVA